MTNQHLTAVRKGNMKMKKIINEKYFTPSFTSLLIQNDSFYLDYIHCRKDDELLHQ